MIRSIVRLPADADEDFEVYVNGVLQQLDVDFVREGRELFFDRALRKDRISGWRWLLGAWGVGTYRQDDTVDIRYEADGETLSNTPRRSRSPTNPTTTAETRRWRA